MSGDEMTDEDRSAAPDDGRSGPTTPVRTGSSGTAPATRPGSDPVSLRRVPTGTVQPTEFRPRSGPLDPDATAATTTDRSPAARLRSTSPPRCCRRTAPPSLRPSPAPTGYPAPGGVPPLTPRPPTAVTAARAGCRRRSRARRSRTDSCCWSPRCWRRWSAPPPATAVRGWPRPGPSVAPTSPPQPSAAPHRRPSSGSAAHARCPRAEPDRHRPGRGRRRCRAP